MPFGLEKEMIKSHSVLLFLEIQKEKKIFIEA